MLIHDNANGTRWWINDDAPDELWVQSGEDIINTNTRDVLVNGALRAEEVLANWTVSKGVILHNTGNYEQQPRGREYMATLRTVHTVASFMPNRCKM